jgi:hypothetical protein
VSSISLEDISPFVMIPRRVLPEKNIKSTFKVVTKIKVKISCQDFFQKLELL